jgi:beta-lactamase regulating signal transducer with metallopeptidase domain
MIRELFLSDFPLSSCVWQSTIFIVVGLVSSFILRHRSARAHQVLFLAMIAAVIVPIMSILVKHYELGMFVAEPVVTQSPAEDRATASDYGASGIILAEDIEHKPGAIEKDLPSAMAGSESARFPWASIVLCGWIAASLILATRLLVTFVLGVRVLGRALPLKCGRIEQAAHLARAKLGIDKDVKVRSSWGVRSPVIWCWRLRPILLVPSDAGQFDNGVDWAGVLCHELAHWKRRDHISGLLTELVVCILPWHPLLWWAKSRLVRLSEQACDDWVVASGQPGTDYAELLLDLTPGGQMAFVPAVVRTKKGLAGRVQRILQDNCCNPRTGAVWALAVSIVAACLTVGIAFAQTRPASPSAASEPEPAAASSDSKFILDKMIENRNKVENFKCINEQFISFSADILKNIPGLNLKRDRPPEEAQKRTYVYQIDHLALDNKASGRVTMIREEADAKGNRTGNGIRKTTNTWDGENSVRYSETSGRTSATIGGTKQPLVVTKRYAQPWTVFGGEFCNDLTRALEQNEKINIEKQKDGNYRIEFLRSQDTKIIGVIAPNQGYSMILQEIYLKGKLNGTRKARFEQVKPGIWFPVSGEFSTGTTTAPRIRTTMTIKEIKINDPNFYDGLYHVDFAEGTYVTDSATGLLHVSSRRPPLLVGKPLPKLKDLKIDLLAANTAGKMILVCFLDIEQRPSRNCLQQLNARAQELKAKGMAIAAVQASKIDENSLDKWRRKQNISFPFGTVQGDEDRARLTWGLPSLPWLILTDSRHVVAAEGFRLSELDAKIEQIDGD